MVLHINDAFGVIYVYGGSIPPPFHSITFSINFKKLSMKNYLVVLTLVGGMTFTQKAEGRCVDDALVDAFYHISDVEYPYESIIDVNVNEV